ncbi:type VII secretion protein EccB [Actinophytocola xinjiangensis]|uniref:Type VII secretion protein EccB n=1 Tax=Actinophytocola xinjiangensis TaxID=485602 RepID=A0A7Z0WRB9_9PSEU|nr:type VII secretion protein EccB [Actinophytocola xinjiangensis]OLF11178.1 type VII secretion protein EccB [Actinophytocola xinjiangensis]
MASKRDQLQAQQFVVQRATSALVVGETDPEHPPFRRPVSSSFIGVALAIVALACVGVYGMIVPGGNDAWRDPKAVIVESETGTRFVYLDGRLHPVANYASAVLLVGQGATTKKVSRDSMVDVPRGPRLGIADAPDALPGTDRLLTDSWSLCSTPANDMTGGRVEESVLLVGATADGGHTLGDQGLLVRLAETDERYLVWRGHRHQLVDYAVTGTGLAMSAQPWARVGRAWLDVLPEGDPISPIPVPDAGSPSTAVPGREDLRTGAIVQVLTSGGTTQYYLVGKAELRPITELQYDVQRAYAPTRAAYPDGDPAALPLSASLATAAQAPDPSARTDGDVPAQLPEITPLRDGGSTVCAMFAPEASVPRLLVDAVPPPADPLAATAVRTPDGTPLADRVHVRPGWAAVVEAMPSATAQVGTLVVVTDTGRRYSVLNPDVLGSLGYGGVTPVRLPGGLVARLPAGPALDPNEAARQPLSG